MRHAADCTQRPLRAIPLPENWIWEFLHDLQPRLLDHQQDVRRQVLRKYDRPVLEGQRKITGVQLERGGAVRRFGQRILALPPLVPCHSLGIDESESEVGLSVLPNRVFNRVLVKLLKREWSEVTTT